ncbi:MAG: toxin-antitoxin system YwqK family antitoxin [Formivibrio sp.]|nr:toxin-antitoxin system YwqK family antitoxin [Formivibrio sp.]
MNKRRFQTDPSRMQWCFRAIAMLAALSLVACGKSILDYRNAQVINGRIYAGNANTPFTGQLTNVPGKLVLGSPSPGEVLLSSFVQFRNVIRTVGLKVPVAEFTVCDAQISDGLLDGKTNCNAEQSDIPMLQMAFKKGVLDGKLEYDNPGSKNQVISTVMFKAGLLDSKQEIFSPKTQKLIHVLTWKNGVPDGEEAGFNEDSGKQIMHATLVNGKYDGEFIQYAPDGERVIYKATLVQGVKNGDEDQYSPDTGKPVGHGQWSNGIAQGVFRQWDASGKLVSDKTYENGVEVTSASNGQVSPTPASIDACVATWSAAFHKEKGDDALVNYDQISEWEQWCKAGKHPG